MADDDSKSTGDAPAATPLSPLTVRATAGGATYAVEGALSSWTVDELKAAVAAVAGGDAAPAAAQRLIYKGRVLKDGDSLEAYGERGRGRERG